MYPRVEIDAAGVLRNFGVVSAMSGAAGISVSVVTKALAGYRPLVELLVGAGAASIGEAHIHNLRQWDDLAVEKWMIRLPLVSQADLVVRYSDVSLNTEVATIRALGRAGVAQGRTHKVVLMVETGDTREGILVDDVARVCDQVEDIAGVELYGLGTEFGCYSDVVPSTDKMNEFVEVVRDTQTRLGRRLVVSGGSSNVLKMLEDGLVPGEINHLRLGEALWTGRAANYLTPLPGGSLDPFTLSAEIIEVQEKPSMPEGPRAPGEIPVAGDPRFPDLGVRKRALVAVGKQDVGVQHLVPCDPDVRVLEASSDVFVADITDCSNTYRVGDILRFKMDYSAILPAMVSQFVEKEIIGVAQ